MDKENIRLFGQEIGHRYTLNVHEVKAVGSDPACQLDPAIRELLMFQKPNGDIQFTEWFGVIYTVPAKLIETTLAKNGFETTIISSEFES